MLPVSKRILFVCFFAMTLNLQAQEIYHFTTGLFASVPAHYGREAIYTDPLAFQLYNGTLKTPVEDAAFGKDDSGKAVIWKKMKADSLNTLSAPGTTADDYFRRSGYIYLAYRSDENKTGLLQIKGNSSVFFNGEPHAGDVYASGYLYLPVQLKKGLNEMYVRGRRITANLIFPKKLISIHTDDPTLPSVIKGEKNDSLSGAIVIINSSLRRVDGLTLKSHVAGREKTIRVPAILPLSVRKVRFDFDAADIITDSSQTVCTLDLMQKGQVIDHDSLRLEVIQKGKQYASTFISSIDGSLQYYAVVPQLPSPRSGAALVLSVHGAGVEALGQARAYQSKDWTTIVTATNRRPRGFNWEDWGRLDALEVWDLAQKRFQPDPAKVYLTGHSMGGHGTWFLGATYPDKWAAIAPSAGYASLKEYGSADGLLPDSSRSPEERALLSAGNQSDVVKLATNLKALGVYILHGDSDEVVPVKYARQMRSVLAGFQPDMAYYEYPGGHHWFGNESVDWKYIFDYFKGRALKPDSNVNNIDFITANPGISASFRWATILQQEYPLQYSRIELKRERSARTIIGKTKNIKVLKLDLKVFAAGERLAIELDSQLLKVSGGSDVYLSRNGKIWGIGKTPAASEKNPSRYGAFKDAFNHNMLFVYGTKGTKEENDWGMNKARFDAETWYYRGNGSVDIISDREFLAGHYKDRGIILFGNRNTNSAWDALLKECPIQVERSKITAGGTVMQGDDLAAYFIWPLHDSPFTSVAVIGGTGIKGLKAANGNQYFAGASGFPDYMIFSEGMLQSGAQDVKLAGYYDNQWKLEPGQRIDTVNPKTTNPLSR